MAIRMSSVRCWILGQADVGQVAASPAPASVIPVQVALVRSFPVPSVATGWPTLLLRSERAGVAHVNANAAHVEPVIDARHPERRPVPAGAELEISRRVPDL